MSNVFKQKPAPGEHSHLSVWLPVAVMCTAIAIESTHIFSSNHTGQFLRPFLERLFGPISDEHFDAIHHVLRKTGHFVGYGTLALTWLRAWLIVFAKRVPRIPLTPWRWRSAAMALCGTTFIASCDELHQFFMPDRTGVLSDVWLDTIGGACFILITALLFWRREHADFSRV